jgi:hypothetical protein
MAASIDELIEQAESLLRKKIAIKESVPGVFEALSNVDDQLRLTINEIVLNQQDGDLTNEQVRLINTALVGTRTAIATYQADYRPTVNDLTAEFAILPQVNLRNLKKLKERDSELYDSLVTKYGVITETDFGGKFGEEDFTFLNNKEAVYNILKSDKNFQDNGYIDDNTWSDFIKQARGKSGALWGTGAVLSTAAKLLQERYGFEFNVKYLENPKDSQNKEEGAMPLG